MGSDYINNVELKRALERDERGEARVIPVILRHATWKIPTLRNLQALPTDAKPIKSWSDLDEAFVNVTEGIHKVAVELISNQNLLVQNASSNTPISEPVGATESISLKPNIHEESNQNTSYQLFFADLLERLKTARPGITDAKKTQHENFWMLGAGKSGFEFLWTFSREGLKTGLIINIPGNLDATKKAFDSLYEQRADIEKEFGQSLLWERRSEGKESHISLIRLATMTDPQQKMEQTKEWAVETMLKFVGVFRKRIRML